MSLHIEEDLHIIFEWCCNNSLLVNPEKTKMLVVGTRQLLNQLESPVHINFMGENLTPVTEVKGLGMLLDSHLTYDKHIQALSSLCISKLRQIGRVKHNFDQSTLATIIDTLNDETHGRTGPPPVAKKNSQQLASVAQLVRALHRNRRAVGSIPTRGPCAAFFAAFLVRS